MTLLHIIPNVAQGCTQRPHKVPQVGGNALGADPSNPSQGDRTAEQSVHDEQGLLLCFMPTAFTGQKL